MKMVKKKGKNKIHVKKEEQNTCKKEENRKRR